MGGAIEYAINAGNQNENRGRQYMGMAILLLGGFSLLFTALFLFAGPQILGLFGASGEILEYSSEYLRFVAMGRYSRLRGLVWFRSSATWAERSPGNGRPW